MKAIRGVGWMPVARRAEEGRGQAAKCLGESLAGRDPRVSEWGNPSEGTQAPPGESIARRGAPGELKHLSTPRKREDPRSSGERNGGSPNPCRVQGGCRCGTGVGGRTRPGSRPVRELQQTGR